MRLQIQLLLLYIAAADSIKQIVHDLCNTLAYSDITNYSDVDMALSICENSFSKEANDRFNSIFERRNRLMRGKI